MENHPLRERITTEVHARPFQPLRPELGLIHIAVSCEPGESGLDSALASLLDQLKLSQPDHLNRFFYQESEQFALRYEPHNEFYSLTLYQFGDPHAADLAELWQSLPGQLLSGVKISFKGADTEKPDLRSEFGERQVSGGEVMGGAARVWTDFYPTDDHGFVKVLVHDISLKAFQAGRLLQRLCEIETYRHMALLALPTAQSSMPQLTDMDQELADITHEIADHANAQCLLKRLMRLAARVEELSADTANRFSATQAYFALVDSRLAELREERISGLQTVAQFMERRLDPAKRTCQAANDRIERLSRRIARTTELLRSQVDLSIEQQNQQLLTGLNNRAKRQLRLQAKLESFTIIVVTYYAFDLLERSIRNMVSADALRDQILMILSFSVPLIAGLLWWYVGKLLRHYSEEE